MTTPVTCTTKEEAVREVAARLPLILNESERMRAAELLLAQLDDHKDIFALSAEFTALCHGAYRACGSLGAFSSEMSSHGFGVYLSQPYTHLFNLVKVTSRNGTVSYEIDDI